MTIGEQETEAKLMQLEASLHAAYTLGTAGMEVDFYEVAKTTLDKLVAIELEYMRRAYEISRANADDDERLTSED